MKTCNIRYYIPRVFLALILFSSVLTACDEGNNGNPGENNHVYLKEYQFVAFVSKIQILFTASLNQDIYRLVSTRSLFDVMVYRVNYKTVDVEGEEIIASGAVVLPITTDVLPVLSYQHGTLFNPTDAPSNFSTGIEVRVVAPIFASAGYAVSVPDYLGYGVSADYPHPYEHAKTSGSASFDMLMAAKELFKELKITTNDKLFLAGYSQGGNATMALHKHIEENSDLAVTMSAPGSGAYNKTAFAMEVLKKDEDLKFLPNYLWVIDSYNWIYGLNRPWNYYVNEPYATMLETITDPAKLASADIDRNPQALLTEQMREGILNGTDTELLNAFADNDIFDWKPIYPITLYYGTADDYVLPLNSETAYEALFANGADVARVVYEGLNHGTAILPYVLDVFELFESLK